MNEMNVERIYVLLARRLANEASSTELLELDELLQKHPSLSSAIKKHNRSMARKTSYR